MRMTSIRYRAAFVGALALAAGAACSSDPAPAAPPVDDGLKAACDALFDAQMARESTCTGVTLDDAAKAALKARARTTCTASATAPGTSTDKGAVDACTNALAQSTCDARDERPLCRPAPGKLESGAPCFDERQCKSGFCKHESAGATLARCGKCAPLLEPGAACTLNDRCVKDAACLNGACVRFTVVGVGAACVGQGNVKCEDGLVCAESGKCAERIADGQPCKSSPECGLDLICKSSRCASRLAEGAACKGSEECQSGLVCGPKSGKCERPKHAAPGEKCDGALTQCTTGPCSAATNGVCPEVRGEGGACDPADKKTTCDRFLRCVEGACAVDDATACK